MMLNDIEIAQNQEMLPIQEVANKLEISCKNIEPYGHYKAKLSLQLINDEKISENILVLVTAITPTPAGEGKTTVSIGLNDGLNYIGKQSTVVLREPSLGPVFGLKGGAAGGGYSQVVPMDDINLHFNGDFNAVEKANNLLAALIDNHLHFGNALSIDVNQIKWKRVIDMNDRALRNIVIGLNGKSNGVPREEGFNITPASEIMAILCMSKDLEDLKNRLGQILIAFNQNGEPIYAKQLQAQDAMAILLKDAIKPNLVQTLEGNPAIIHGGPFANIAQGTNTIIATKTALSLSNYVITEAGFGADLGAEKFLNIKCASSGLKPKAVVIVATLKALRHHGGAVSSEFKNPNLELVKKGFENLEKHIENIRKFGLEPLVALNHFYTDTEEEIEWLRQACSRLNCALEVSKGFAEGGKGAQKLAQKLVEVIENSQSVFKPLYEKEDSLESKIERICGEIYGAKSVEYSAKAKSDLKKLNDLGLSQLRICIAKTQKSFSDNENLIGRPQDFTIHIREIEFATGAGFIIPIAGKLLRMPGLPSKPASNNMFIDAEGKIEGLS